MGWQLRNIKELKKAIAEARKPALEEAREGYKWVRSRGTFVATLNGMEQCGPYIEADAYQWKRTWKHIAQAVEEVMAKHPHVTEVYLAGGYDGAESCADLYEYQNYEPWVSSWHVTVWTRDTQTTGGSDVGREGPESHEHLSDASGRSATASAIATFGNPPCQDGERQQAVTQES